MATIFDSRPFSKKMERQIKKIGQIENTANEILESIDKMTMNILTIAPEAILWENEIK